MDRKGSPELTARAAEISADTMRYLRLSRDSPINEAEKLALTSDDAPTDEDAISLLERSISVFPIAHAYKKLGDRYTAVGEEQKAADAYQSAENLITGTRDGAPSRRTFKGRW